MQMQDEDIDQEGEHENDVLGDSENLEGEEDMMELLQVPEEPEPWEKEVSEKLKPKDNDVEMEQKNTPEERKARDGPKGIIFQIPTTSKFVGYVLFMLECILHSVYAGSLGTLETQIWNSPFPKINCFFWKELILPVLLKTWGTFQKHIYSSTLTTSFFYRMMLNFII